MKSEKNTTKKRKRRAIKVRASLNQKEINPRLSVFKSGRHIYAQIIDDQKMKTIASASTFNMKKEKKNKSEKAKEVGKAVALKAKEQGISKVVFDRGRYRYHGRVKSLAEGARAGGLKF